MYEPNKILQCNSKTSPPDFIRRKTIAIFLDSLESRNIQNSILDKEAKHKVRGKKTIEFCQKVLLVLD